MMFPWAIAVQEPFQRTQFVMVARSEVRDVPEAQALVKPVKLQVRHVKPIVNAMTAEARAHRPVQLDEARA